MCDSYLETFEEMLKPLSVDTNYLECGHKLGSNSSLFGGWIYLTLLSHSQVERLMVQKSVVNVHNLSLLMTIMNRNDKEAVRQLLLAAVAVPGALWGTSCLFLVFIGNLANIDHRFHSLSLSLGHLMPMCCLSLNKQIPLSIDNHSNEDDKLFLQRAYAFHYRLLYQNRRLGPL